MRKLAAALSAVVMSVAPLPATAQYGQVERTQAEIALEEATANLEKNRARRTEAMRACGTNDYQACFELADMYRRGLGGDQDYDKAADNYRKACNGKLAKACSGLAYLTIHGRGMEADPVQARQLYDKACDYGDVSGCAAYGNMVYTGQGGRKNVPEGTRLLQESCDEDYEWACERLSTLGAYQADDSTWERLEDVKRRY
jgi:TPR repeat protein